MQTSKVSTATSMTAALPDLPGCYIFWDKAGDCLYVGKSKRVKSRVKSYFNKNNSPKVKKLAKLIARIEYRPATDEISALYLEHGLIKTYRPPFNSQMKKDIHSHYICIEWNRAKPGVYISDRPARVATRYGGFNSVYDAKEALTQLNRAWAIPICESRHFDGNAKDEHSGNKKPTRGCLNLHIERCHGPCQQALAKETYRENLQKAASFMQGSSKQALKELKRDMKQAATDHDYETAAQLRDIYNDLYYLQRRFVYRVPFQGRRLCVLIKGYHEPSFMLLYYKNGLLKHAVRLNTQDEWTIKQDMIVSDIVSSNKATDILPDLGKIYTSTATQEIRAKKLYVDLTKTPKARLVTRLDGAVNRFITNKTPREKGR